jgi:3-oxoacyl-[acyl-carrier-protein] synthase-3
MKLIMNQLILPNRTVSVEELHIQHGKTIEDARATIENTGFLTLRSARTDCIEVFLAKAYTSLTHKFISACRDVSAIVCVTQSQSRRIPNLAANVQAALSIEVNVLALDLIDGCNGFIKALRIADAVLAPGERALIVSGELNSPMLEGAELGTKILFGDGFAFTLVERDEESAPAMIKNDGVRGPFIDAMFVNPMLRMNGFEVFRFTNIEVPKLVKACNWTDPNEREASDIFALHQASKLVVHQIAKRLGILEQTPEVFSMKTIGNLASGSIPAWLALNSSLIAPSCKVHCVGFGAGLSWGLVTVNNSLIDNRIDYVDV